AILSAVKQGGQVIVFARSGGRLENLLRRQAAVIDLSIVPPPRNAQSVAEVGPVWMIPADTRAEEDRLTARLFPRFDYLVAPPHERSNWALGLGLPMFAVVPCYGSFAPRNLALLTGAGVAMLLDDATAPAFGEALAGYRRQGDLEAMARAGRGKCAIDGFETIAARLHRDFLAG
ncbi:MAG: hypothetical protein KKA42_04290, partial [candidate division Zixibacteria bacterium]|nr:hypothetical protein [candidate division Zixibacteria bacterium]